MRIGIIGGGPGGLFFAVLMKRAGPSREITVFERNAADATFGFGVVFPERSLRYLREADPDTHQAFMDACVSWEDIAYRHRGRSVRCGGNEFSGIARTALLSLLERRAGGVGVDLRFQHEVRDLSEVAGCDLVVAADGVNSLARRELGERFKPSVHVGRSRYIWLGTTKVFDALTFIFEESEHGWFGAHIYPYSDAASTFIVETDEETWRRAGLDRSTEAAQAPGASDLESLRYCEALFARHLDGHPLLANNSKWLNFRTVKNRVWHAGDVVLLGDAAHTAHFSVGSGTRMAIEDAIALARALERDADLPAALQAYERERRPAVSRIQRAAEPSRRWWEGFRHWMHFDAEQFAFHHMARTRLLTYGILKVRDPTFIAAAEVGFAEAAFASGGGAPPAGGNNGVSPAWAVPLSLGDLVLSNRIVAARADDIPARDAIPGQRYRAYLTGRAAAGAGLVMSGPTAVSPDGRGRSGRAGLWSPEHVEAWRRITEFVHARTRARIGLHLGDLRPPDEWHVRLIDEHVRAARLGTGAGFDLLELPCAADASLPDPALDLLEAVRPAWPPGRPLAVRVPAWADPENDRIVGAGLEFARALAARGCDLVTVAVPHARVARDSERARAAQVFTSDLIRNVVGIPTMIVGGSYTVGDVIALILAGRADVCEWPRLAWTGWVP